MTLFARNLSTSPVTLPVDSAPVIIPSLIDGVRGNPVDVTNDMRPDLSIDPVNGVSGGLDLTGFALVQNMVSAGTVLFEWSGTRDYKVGALKILHPFQLSNLVVGKDSCDEYSGINEAAELAGLFSSPGNPVVVYVKPGVYDEDINVSGSVHILALRNNKEYYEFNTDSVIINGKINITGGVGDVSTILGVKITPVTPDPVVSINTLGKVYLTDVLVGDKSFSTTLVVLLSGDLYLLSSSILAYNPRLALHATGGSVTSYDSIVGSQGLGNGVISDNSDYIEYARGQMGGSYGKMTFTGTGIVRLDGNKHVTTHQITIDATRSPVTISDIAMEQNSSAVNTTILCGGVSKVIGSIKYGNSTAISNMSLNNLYPPQNSVTSPTFINQLNCDKNLVLKTTTGNLTLSKQQRICIINKVADEATSVTLPTNPIRGEEHIVVDGKGNADVRNVTVLGGGKNIDGLASSVLSIPRGNIHVIFNGTEWKKLMN